MELSFTDVRVPVENLLGEEGKGFSYVGQNLPRERLVIGIVGAATAAAAVEFTKEFVQQRTVFGNPVASFQNSTFVLAECTTEVEPAQALADKGSSSTRPVS